MEQRTLNKGYNLPAVLSVCYDRFLVTRGVIPFLTWSGGNLMDLSFF